MSIQFLDDVIHYRGLSLEWFSIECRKYNNYYVISELLWFCITSLSDWYKVLAPLFQPIRVSETKTNRGLPVHIFPCFVLAACNNNYFEF